jgi:hypothetical protein
LIRGSKPSSPADLCRDGLRGAILSEICQQQEQTREPFLAGIEQLVDQVLFDAAVSTEKIRHEQFGKLWLALKRSKHRNFRDRSDHTFFHGRGR